MEALAAISLAGNILQFVGFSGKVIVQGLEFHRSRSGALRSHVQIQNTLDDLEKLMMKLQNPPKLGVKSTQLDEGLQRSLHKCKSICGELQQSLEKFKSSKKKHFWTNSYKAFQAVLSEDRLKELRDKLSVAQQEVQLHISVEQREQLRIIVEQQQTVLDILDNVSWKICQNVLKGIEALSVGQALLSEQMKSLHEEQKQVLESKLGRVDVKLEEILENIKVQSTPDPHELASGLELCQAVREGQYTNVASLIARGADVNYNRYGDTGEGPLHLAAKEGKVKILLLLLSEKPFLDAYSAQGLTPLMSAAIAGAHGAIGYLLDAGCNMELGLRLARPRPIDTIDIDDDLTEGSSALFLAAYNGHLSAVRDLLARGANTENTSNHGFTPLIAAARSGHTRIVVELLDKRANIEAKTDQGFTSLTYTANAGRLETARILIDRGANLNTKKSFGMNPLLEACWMQRLEMVDLLVSRGADLDARSSQIAGLSNATALHLAASFGNIDIVRRLLEARPDVSLWNGCEDLESPYHIAKRLGHRDLAEFLKPKSQEDAIN